MRRVKPVVLVAIAVVTVESVAELLSLSASADIRPELDALHPAIGSSEPVRAFNALSAGLATRG